MFSRWIKALIFGGMAALFVLSALAAPPTIESLQAEIKKAEEEIRVSNELLEKNRKDQKLSQSELKIVRNKINNRKNIISKLENQIAIINSDIESRNSNIGKLNKELETLKKEYAQMIYESYKNYKLNNFLVFLFASRDFNDATRRIEYMRRYNTMREEKAAEITALSQRITNEIVELDTKREELNSTRTTRSDEITKLSKDENQYQKSVNTLKANEKKLASTVKQKQQQINKAQQQIQKIIAEEAKKNQNVKRTAAEQEQFVALSGRFEDNKGKLPYPVSGGVVIDQYGTHPHPTQKGITVNNKGINIAAAAGAEVRCVFEGVVTRIFFFQGLNNNIMVRHGDYITVYSNLETVGVKTGDKVAINQRLGTISSGSDSDDHMVHFEIWKETTNLNPSQWLRR